MANRYRLSANIKFNIKSYLEREFINQGLYFNVASGSVWRAGQRIDTLYRVNQEKYESYFNNWIYETDASGISSYNTTVCNGVYIDGIFHSKGSGVYKPVINYRKGQVLFDGPSYPTALQTVSAVFSYKHAAVEFVDSDASNLLFSLYKDNVDYTENAYASGLQRQLPLVVIDLQKRIGMPWELGGSKQYSQLVVFHILSNTSHELEQIVDILSERMYRKVIKGVDFNSVPKLLTYQGDVASTYKNYTDLQNDSSYTFPKIYIDNAEIIEMWNRLKMHYARVHWKLTIYKSAV